MTVQNPLPPGSAIVTPEQMYAEARATHDAVVELKNLVTTTVKDQTTTLQDHEQRLRAVERAVWRAAGIAAVLAGAAGLAAGYLPGHVN